MKVIIYGVENTQIRLQVEKELGNTHEVIGYIVENQDSSISSIKVFYEYKCMISMQHMEKYSYDYIILLAQTLEENNRKLDLLLKNHVTENKVVEYYWFGIYGGGISFRNPLKDFYKINCKFHTWILGMSYAVRGVYVHYLNNAAYKFCSPGMDLHYHLSCIRALINSDCYKPSRIIMDLPYYIFNYDLSLTKRNKVRMFHMYENFNDWHNFGKQENDEKYLSQYKVFEQLFREKRERCSSVWSNNIEVYPVKYLDVSKIDMDSFHNIGMWNDIHEETIKENRRIWLDIVKTVKEWDSDIEIIAWVIPHSKYEQMYYADEILRMKNIYYDSFRLCDNCKIIDWFHEFDSHDEYFMDVEHLNTSGGIALSKMLADELEYMK